MAMMILKLKKIVFNFDGSNHVGKFVRAAVACQNIGNGVDEMFGAAIARQDGVIDDGRSVELAFCFARDGVNGFRDGNVANGIGSGSCCLDGANVVE